VVVYIVLCLDNELFESSHEVLDCFLALFKGEEALLCIAPDVRWLERLLELVRKLVEGAYSIEPLCDVQVRPSSCCVLSFHIGQDDQDLLSVRRFLFKAGEVQLDRAPPLDVLGPFTIIWFGLSGDGLANTDVWPYEQIGGEEPWGLRSRWKVDPRGPWHVSCSRNGRAGRCGRSDSDGGLELRGWWSPNNEWHGGRSCYVRVVQGLRVPGMVGPSEVIGSLRDRSHIEIDGTRR